MSFQCDNIDHPIEFIFVVVNKSHIEATPSTHWLHYEIIRVHTFFDVIIFGTFRDLDFLATDCIRCYSYRFTGCSTTGMCMLTHLLSP